MSAIAPPLILNGYTNEVQLEDVNKFDGLIIVLIGLIMTWTLLAMAGSLAMDIVRKTPIWRRRRSIAGAPATPRLQAKGRFRRVLSWCANIVRLTLRFWYGPALLFYLLGLFSVFRPWIDDPAAFEVRVGDSAYARADFGEALSWYAEAAERDNVRAKSKIVNMFQYNSALASATLYWVRRAAESGDAEAQTKMGDMYFYRSDGGPDYTLAMAWYRKAADQDDANAENNIGYMYHFALGVPQDFKTAMQWYLKAAAHDHAGAENNLGVLYMNGAGVAIDYHQAMAWFRKAARHGSDNGRAKFHIGELYDRGLGVPKEPGLALDWMQKAAEDGDAAAKKWLELH
jgi:tetratricopeptide (TPR) repeat protein